MRRHKPDRGDGSVGLHGARGPGPVARPPATTARGRLLFSVTAVVLCAFVALVYVPALKNGFVWDDRQLIVENQSLTAPGALAASFTQDFWEAGGQERGTDYYRPLVTVSYVLDRRLHGLEPMGYHATTLAIHLIVTMLLFVWLTDLGLETWLGLLGAALFGVHPVLAESAAWIAGRTDPLATLFVLACLFADRRRDRLVWRAAALASFACGLLSKEIAVVTPAVAVLQAAWVPAALSRRTTAPSRETAASSQRTSAPPRETAASPQRTSAPSREPAALRGSGASGEIDSRHADPRHVDPRQADLRQIDPQHVDPRQADPRKIDPRHVDPHGVETLRSAALRRIDLVAVLGIYLAARWLTLGAATAHGVLPGDPSTVVRLTELFHLAGILVLPWFSRIEYPSQIPFGPILPSACAGLIVVAVLALSVMRANARRSPIGGERSAGRPGDPSSAAHHGAGWWTRWRMRRVGPALALPDAAHQRDGSMRGAAVSRTAGAIGGMHDPAASRVAGTGGSTGGRVSRLLSAAGLLSLAPALAAILVKGVMGDRFIYLGAAFIVPALVTLVAERVPRKVLAPVALALAGLLGAFTLHKSTQWESDATLFSKASEAPFPSARVFLNLGIAYHDAGRLVDAYKTLERSRAMSPLSRTLYTLGLIYTEVGCIERAVASYEYALRVDADYLAPANNLGALLAEQGRFAEAERVISAAIAHSRNPSHELATNLERLRAHAGTREPDPAPRPEPGCSDTDALLSKMHDVRFLNRRAVEMMRGSHLDQARVLLRAADRIEPGHVPTRLNLAQWHFLNGDLAASRKVIEEVLRKEPDNAAARKILGYIEEAERSSRKRADPGSR